MSHIVRLSGSETEPVKLDLKDKKIMAILVDDARISLTQLAKKVGLKRETVDYRIKKLIEKKIITGFAPFINFKMLGYSFFEIFLLFDEIGDTKRKELLSELTALPSVMNVIEYNDRWDVKITILAKDIEEFDSINDKIQRSLGKQLLEKERLALLSEYAELSASELFQPGKRVFESKTKKKEKPKIDEKDRKILKCLSEDCRQSTYQIADKLKISPDGVGLRIKKMVESGVIEKFATWYDNSKFPLYWHTFAAKLNSFDQTTENKIKNLINENSKIKSARKTLGNWDILFSIVAESQKEIHQSVKEIRKSLSGSMKNYQTWLAYKEVYFNPFPEVLLKP